MGLMQNGHLTLLPANASFTRKDLRHSELHLISDAEIPKIGAGRKQILASYNIFTAADIDEVTIREIKGFGYALTSNLMAWKAEVLQKFRFNPATALSPGEQRKVTGQFRTRQQQLLAELDRQLTKLESRAPTCRIALQTPVPRLREAVAFYEQAEEDLRVMSGR